MQTTDQAKAGRALQPVVTLYQTAILTLVLLVVFTPFESPGSYISVLLPRFAVLLGLLLVAPALMLRPVRLLRPAWVLLGAVLLHMTVVVPPALPLQLVAEWVGFIACVLLVRIAVTRRSAFLLAVRVTLLLNVAALLLQAASAEVLGAPLDLHGLLFPGSEARTGAEAFGFLRSGGFHIEPGTYATWVAMLIVIARLLAGRFYIVEWVAIFSLLVTYSTAAAIYFCILGLWNLLDALGERRARSLGMITVLVTLGGIAFVSLGMDRYLHTRFALETGVERQEELRLYAYEVYRDLPLSTKILGFGHTREICDDCYFDDMGFGPNLLARGGFLAALGLIVTVFGLIRLLGLNSALLTLLVVGSAKAATNALAPWIVLLVASEVGMAAVREARKAQHRANVRRPPDPVSSAVARSR